jgi:hypothetical protein
MTRLIRLDQSSLQRDQISVEALSSSLFAVEARSRREAPIVQRDRRMFAIGLPRAYQTQQLARGDAKSNAVVFSGSAFVFIDAARCALHDHMTTEARNSCEALNSG